MIAKKKPKPKTLVNRAACATHFGVSERTISYWVAAGCPTENGRYDLEAVVTWRESRPSIGGRPAGPLREQKMRAEIAKLRQEARAKRTKNELTEGQLYDAADVETNVAELTIRIKERLEAIPDEIEMLIPPEVRSQVKEDVANHVCLILKEMTKTITVGGADAETMILRAADRIRSRTVEA